MILSERADYFLFLYNHFAEAASRNVCHEIIYDVTCGAVIVSGDLFDEDIVFINGPEAVKTLGLLLAMGLLFELSPNRIYL